MDGRVHHAARAVRALAAQGPAVVEERAHHRVAAEVLGTGRAGLRRAARADEGRRGRGGPAGRAVDRDRVVHAVGCPSTSPPRSGSGRRRRRSGIQAGWLGCAGVGLGRGRSGDRRHRSAGLHRGAGLHPECRTAPEYGRAPEYRWRQAPGPCRVRPRTDRAPGPESIWNWTNEVFPSWRKPNGGRSRLHIIAHMFVMAIGSVASQAA